MATFPEVFNQHMLERVDGPRPANLFQNRVELALLNSIYIVAIEVIGALRDASVEYFDRAHETCSLNTHQLVCIGAAIATLAALPIALAELPIRLIEGVVLSILLCDLDLVVLPIFTCMTIVESVINLPELIDVDGKPDKFSC
ncbi:MAG: hypothetical protein S4CHLAM102_01640 [Chlamydiia bacterium]|nr:hypothetical protein [Chlamydiia bacterium]